MFPLSSVDSNKNCNGMCRLLDFSALGTGYYFVHSAGQSWLILPLRILNHTDIPHNIGNPTNGTATGLIYYQHAGVDKIQ